VRVLWVNLLVSIDRWLLVIVLLHAFFGDGAIYRKRGKCSNSLCPTIVSTLSSFDQQPDRAFFGDFHFHACLLPKQTTKSDGDGATIFRSPPPISQSNFFEIISTKRVMTHVNRTQKARFFEFHSHGIQILWHFKLLPAKLKLCALSLFSQFGIEHCSRSKSIGTTTLATIATVLLRP